MEFTEETFCNQCESQAELLPCYLIHRESADYSEYVDKTAEAWGYHNIGIRYNRIGFGAAVDIVSRASLLLTPYYRVEFPLVPIAPYVTCPYDVLVNCGPQVPDDIFTDPADIAMVNHLPNGYHDDAGVRYMGMLASTRRFRRISAGIAVSGVDINSGFTLLHPWAKRALTSLEIDALLRCTFADFIRDCIGKFAVSETPLTPLIDVLDWRKERPYGYGKTIPNTFSSALK